MLIGIPALLVVVPLSAYAIDRLAGSGEIARNVTIADVPVGGLSEADALAALDAHEAEMQARTATFVVEGDTYALAGSTVGLGFDKDAAVTAALAANRSGGVGDVFAWLGSFTSTENITVDYSVDSEAVEIAVESFEQQSIDDPAFDGGVAIESGVAVAEYPRAGRRIDRSGITDLVLDSLTADSRLPLTLDIESVSPRLTDADIDAAVEEANLLISEPIVLAAADPDVSILFTSYGLASALRSEVVENSPTSIELWFDEDTVAELLSTYQAQIEQPPRDAAFVLAEEGGVEILPSRSGTKLDVLAVTSILDDAARRASRTAVFPFAEGDPAAFTTEDAESMGPFTKVSEFTTKHPCCQSRVTNIQLIADSVDGTVVWPGEVFSLNQTAGERTREKGYVEGGMIGPGGELVDAIGGGVSQFATTIYNAVFFGCYEDVEHKPHSQYFSRYPVVREATVNWPSIDLKWRNDSDAVVVIDTKYTDTSITVEFWGNNGGRTCTSETSGRYAYREPTTEYIPDPLVNPGEPVTESDGLTGWTARVTRFMEMPDGEVIEQEWTWSYRMKPMQVRIHPCEIPEDDPLYTGEECPLEIAVVVGMTVADAIAALEAQGFVVTVATPIDVADPAQEGLVQTQDPTGFAPLETVITITPGVYVEPPPEEPPPDEGS
ncbi:MAG: PASTA domain-containing protein [Acidimicrobiia bacterium]|nr:PASTA domain-containing protein [Acidimicrobiia bacterium]